MKKEILGKCMLLMSALIWGSSFIVMKNAVDFISPFTLLCIRFVLSTIFISILFFNKIKKIKKQDLLGGFLAGLALFSAFSIQTFGLQLTTPGKNAFLTAVYCTIVPLLSSLPTYKNTLQPHNYQSVFVYYNQQTSLYHVF